MIKDDKFGKNSENVSEFQEVLKELESYAATINAVGGRCIWCEEVTTGAMIAAIDNGDSLGPFFVVPLCNPCKEKQKDSDLRILEKKLRARFEKSKKTVVSDYDSNNEKTTLPN